MKKYLRQFFVNFLSFWLTGKLITGVYFGQGLKTMALAAVSLTAINLIIKPLIKILLLPINFLTLGGFRWLINVLALYLVTQIVSQFEISSFLFEGFTYQGFSIPEISFSTFWAYVIASFFLSLVTTFLLWLSK